MEAFILGAMTLPALAGLLVVLWMVVAVAAHIVGRVRKSLGRRLSSQS